MRKAFTLFLAASFTLNSWAEEGESHCKETEKTVFNCAIKGSKKVASICEGKHLAYRFGPTGSPEFVYPSPENDQPDEENFRYSASRMRDYSANQFKLQFYNDSYSYMAYAVEMQGTGDVPRYMSSVIVWKTSKQPPGGKVI